MKFHKATRRHMPVFIFIAVRTLNLKPVVSHVGYLQQECCCFASGRCRGYS